MKTAQNNFEDTIDITLIMRALLRRWPLYLASLLIGGILLFVISQFVLPKMYESQIELFVNNTEIKSAYSNSGNDLTSGDIDASQKLSRTYIVILKNPSVLAEVAKSISNSMTVEELDAAIDMSSVESTEVVRISATTRDPALSAKICDAYAEVAPSVLQRVVKAGSVEIIGDATLGEEPVSPNVLRNALVGAFAALFISIIIVYIAFAFDNTIKGGFDLRQRIDIPVLGEIPSF